MNERTGETVVLEGVKGRRGGGHPYKYAWHVVSNAALSAALERLSGVEQRLLVRLAMTMKEGNLIVATQGAVGAAAGMQAATACRAMKTLKAAGLVRMVGKGMMLDPHVAWRGSTGRLAATIVEWDADAAGAEEPQAKEQDG